MRFETAHSVGRRQHGSSDDPDVLDFSANTNPQTPAGVREVYCEAFEDAQSYPREPPRAYREAAAAYVETPAGDSEASPEEIVPTPGGLAAIRLVVDLAVTPGDSVLVPYPSFSEYEREVRLQDGDPVFVPYTEILDADLSDHALAIVCNPNNPTGDAYEYEELQQFAQRCRESGTVLLVDEAFLGFTDRPSLAGTEGVVVARSLTKLFGLPGIRAGFAVATGELLEALLGARRTWNLGSAALATGAYCMRQTDFVRRTRERVRRERERLREALALAGGFRVVSSDAQTAPADAQTTPADAQTTPANAPFLLLDVGEMDVPSVVDGARERGVTIRDATTFRGLNTHVRVAIRDPEENDRLVEVLRAVSEELGDESGSESESETETAKDER
jgi:histidinol-phosphate/aromatic aminotransferase/cobyric acid decarboxylase-like protein